MAQQPDPVRTVRRQLFPMGLWLRFSDTLLFVCYTLWLGTLLFALIMLAGRLTPIPYLRFWALLPLALWLLVVLGYLTIRPLPVQRIARRVDSALNLRERLATALELHSTHADDELSRLQQQDAASAAQNVHPRQLPLRFNWHLLLVAAVPLAAGIVLWVLPNPQDAILAERQQVAQTIEQVTDDLEELEQQVEQNEELTPEEREQLERQLAELREQLQQNSGNREEALADLSETEARLQQELDPQTDARRAALEEMARNLNDLAEGETGERESLEGAAEQLEDLAEELENMSEEERQELAERLSEQAAQMSSGEPETARSLSEASQALRDGDLQEAADQLEQAAGDVREAQGDIANQDATQQALSEIQESRQQIAQSGQQSQQAQQDQEGQQGQQGQEGQQGQPQGSGTDAPSLGDAQSNSPSEVDPNQSGQGGREAGSQPGDSVYQPFDPSGQQGERDFIEGQQGEGGQVQTQQGDANLPGVNNPSIVPYEQVFPEYSESASEALDRGYIPPHLKDYVRDYFSQLEPGTQGQE